MTYNKICAICKEPYKAKRSDKETCSNACRQKLNRMRNSALLATVSTKKFLAVGKKAPKDYVIQRIGKHFPEPAYIGDYGDRFGKGFRDFCWATRYTLAEAKEIAEAQKKTHPSPGFTITIERFSELATKRLETIRPDSI